MNVNSKLHVNHTHTYVQIFTEERYGQENPTQNEKQKEKKKTEWNSFHSMNLHFITHIRFDRFQSIEADVVCRMPIKKMLIMCRCTMILNYMWIILNGILCDYVFCIYIFVVSCICLDVWKKKTKTKKLITLWNIIFYSINNYEVIYVYV